MKTNACCTAEPLTALRSCDRLNYCGSISCGGKNIRRFYVFGESKDGDIFIPSLAVDDVPETASDYLFANNNARAMVFACDELEETGIIEAKYKLSPIMLLHKLGVLDKCTIAGGVCLDNDDLDLMAQENVPLVLLPTASAGYGHGFAPVCAALKRGIRVGVGTFDGKYNKTHSLDIELNFLRLTANAEMRKENALSEEDIQRILRFD